jgi:RNA 2',3'-cyclic 3'-phosphodiesterase
MNDLLLPEELRLFIAFELPDDWRLALQTVQRDLSRAGLGYLRWVRPEAIHLTLKFLGEAGRHLLPDINQGMLAATKQARPFELRLVGLGSFGSRGRVRVLWAGVEGELKLLQQIQIAIDAEMVSIGFARETRPFSPHLTVARVPDDARPRYQRRRPSWRRN